MPELKKCGACGVDVQSNAPFGHCPQCLLAMGFGPNPRETLELPEEPSAQAAIGNAESANTTVRYIGDYELLEQIGRGGMGVVFKARQISLHRLVAVKMMVAGGFASPESVRRFQLEAEAVAKLNHPNIVPIHEIGVHEGQHYFSMKLVEGGSLRERMAGGKGARGELEKGSRRESANGRRPAVTLLAKIARAVHYAHQHGVLHRDLKPGNILLDVEGEPHITDFGLAKILKQEMGITRTAETMGTPSYMSPEQAAGRQLSTATDLWSLGVIFYELITGRPPFRAENAPALLRKIAEEEPVRPSQLLRDSPPKKARTAFSPSPGVEGWSEGERFDRSLFTSAATGAETIDRDLETICLKCLEKEPARRYASAAGLADDLEHWLRNEPILARRASLLERVNKWAHRQPVLAGFVVALHVVFALGIGGVLWQWRRAEAHLHEESHQRRRAQDATRQAERFLIQMGAVQLERAEEFFAANNRLAALPYWALVLRQNPTNRLAAERLFSTLSHRNWARLACPPLLHSNRLTFASYSPDGSLVLTSSADNTARVWHADTGQPVGGPLIHRSEINKAEFSPDGRLVVTASDDRTARIWDAHTGQPATDPVLHDAAVQLARFSPDSKSFATLSADGIAQLWDAQTAQRLHGPWRAGEKPTTAVFSSDGKLLVAAGAHGLARVWNIGTDELVCELRHTNDVNSIDFSPDSRYIVTASSDTTARIWDAQTGAPLSAPLTHQDELRGAQFSPDGLRVVTYSADKTARIWNVPTGLAIGPPLSHDSTVKSARFSADGMRILTIESKGIARVWDAQTGRPLTEPMMHGLGAYYAEFHPDGQRVLTVGNQRAALIWVISGCENMRLHSPEKVAVVEFSPDGQKVAFAGTNAYLFDTLTGQSLAPPLPHKQAVRSIAFSPNGEWMATGSADGLARVWNPATGKLSAPVLLHRADVTWVGFSPDGARLLTASRDGTARIWNMRDRHQPISTFQHDDEVVCAGFSPDGRQIITASCDGTARIWSAQTGRLLSTLRHDAPVNWAEFSPDGNTVVTASSDLFARVWDAHTGQLIVPKFAHPHGVRRAHFSPDGGRIVTTLERTAGGWIWNLATGKQVGRLGDGVRDATFSLDGSQVLTSSGEDDIAATLGWMARRLDGWAAHRLSEPFNHRGLVRGSRFSPRGSFIATASEDATVCLWEAPSPPTPVPTWLPDLAEALAGQRFNQQGLLEIVPPSELWALQTRLGRLAVQQGVPALASQASAGAEASDTTNALPAEAGTPFDSAFYARWARWFVADANTRTVLPSSPVTLPQYAHALLEQGTAEGGREALFLQPTNIVALALASGSVTNEMLADWMTRRAIELRHNGSKPGGAAPGH